MNYKHAYHAGNFADVVKHILLVQLLNQLGQKNKPFYVLDAYGGRGLYSLGSEEARKTGEAKGGIQALVKADVEKAPTAVKDYMEGIKQARFTYDKKVYPGSPWWIAHHVEKNPDAGVRGEAFEAKASEYDALNYQLHKLPIGIHHRNAFEGIAAVIPPKEKRGLIFLDPPYNPIDETANFTEYTNTGFDSLEQKRLANLFKDLDHRGCKIILSNSDTNLVRELYKKCKK